MNSTRGDNSVRQGKWSYILMYQNGINTGNNWNRQRNLKEEQVIGKKWFEKEIMSGITGRKEREIVEKSV